MGHLIALLTMGLSLSTTAWAATSHDCPYDPNYLSQQLGHKLTVATQMKGLLGHACEYAVDAGPNPAPSAELWRQMAHPPGTRWKRVANDPDGAVTLESTPNGDPFPSIGYEHKGWLVQISVLGTGVTTALNQWHTKLLTLKRLPE